MKNWSAPEVTEDKQQEIESHMKNGYSEREAHRLAGTHVEHSNFNDAMKSNIKPSMMSEKMMSELKPLAKEWLSNAMKQSAETTSRPIVGAAAKMQRAFDEHLGDYHKSYNDFLKSDTVSNLTGKARHDAIISWKKKHIESNSDHFDKIKAVSDSQSSVDDARKKIKQNIDEQISHILGAGSPNENQKSFQEGVQAAGISGGDSETGIQGTIEKDPALSFAEKNKKLMSMLNDEQRERLMRIKSQKTSSAPSSDKQPEQKPKVIRRRSNA